MTLGRDFLAGFLFGGFLVWLWIIYQRQQPPPRTSRIIDIYAQTRKVG